MHKCTNAQMHKHTTAQTHNSMELLNSTDKEIHERQLGSHTHGAKLDVSTFAKELFAHRRSPLVRRILIPRRSDSQPGWELRGSTYNTSALTQHIHVLKQKKSESWHIHVCFEAKKSEILKYPME